MKSSIPLGWLLATVLFALLGNAVLAAVFFIGSVLFGILAYVVQYRSIEGYVVSEVLEGMSKEIGKIDSEENNYGM